ncbi:hypothetical protein MCUN1_000701 [Malassezia cuniculi]|uniref:Prephenate dehydratase domain-containing protein n=1 Tax=Malassezia cuniculi TaxID=948313 RepID=A0AAF0EWC4_9BASI|nr:hypothetical protein MCUN1_000701 [Malassezia cuniculi]
MHALGQCSKFLEQALPHAKRVPTHSTAEAVALLDRYPQDAAVASELAAELAGAKVFRASIQDADDNVTRFVVATCNPDDAAVVALIEHNNKYYNAGPAFRALARVTIDASQLDAVKSKVKAYHSVRVASLDEVEPLDGPATATNVLLVEVVGHNIAAIESFKEALTTLPGHTDFLGAWPLPSGKIPHKL